MGHLRCMSAQTAGIAIIPVPEGKTSGKGCTAGQAPGNYRGEEKATNFRKRVQRETDRGN